VQNQCFLLFPTVDKITVIISISAWHFDPAAREVFLAAHFVPFLVVSPKRLLLFFFCVSWLHWCQCRTTVLNSVRHWPKLVLREGLQLLVIGHTVESGLKSLSLHLARQRI
jgi:hypothetical protein